MADILLIELFLFTVFNGKLLTASGKASHIRQAALILVRNKIMMMAV